ncbi:MAG: universal stress protein [Ilumatobacter sp.]|uniref:universal stress protein n=1 Tax=Ilumatobacter sp. TaxID=1967498 RepID=UPI003C728AA8
MNDRDVPHTPQQPVGRSDGDRWVVGVDGSECSRHAALWAAAHVSGRASELQLAASWNVPVSSGMIPMSTLTSSASFDALEDSAQAAVDDVARKLRTPVEVPITRSVGHGGAAACLLDTADRGALLVVGSRGLGGFARLLLGSTSTQCATHSSVPVAVIPSTSPITPAVSIVVAFDGSANSIAALTWANKFAAPGSTIDCVLVWDTSPITAGGGQFFFPDATDLAEERFEHLVMRTIRPIQRDGIEIRRTFVNGRPRSTLAEFAQASDILVMGARGHGAVASVVLGSVSTWLLHHATRPMVVVPPPIEDCVDPMPEPAGRDD